MSASKYYDVFEDIASYPEAWLIEAHSKRGPGKTYGYIWGCLSRNIKFVYLKRTQIDVNLLSTDDFSPLKPINRDHNTRYIFSQIYEGISGIYESDDDGKPVGNALGYAMAISAIHKYKGFDLSDCDYMCLDEYIPQLGERVNHKEGELLLDLYMTINRDREKRGRQPLKLILFANATELYCPITDTLQIVDELSAMNASGDEFLYLDDRGILLHWIPYSESINENSAVFKGMRGTKWADMAAGGKFAYNDFSRVKKLSLKNMLGQFSIVYNSKEFFIYQHPETGMFYMCSSRSDVDETYNMDIEADRRRYWLEWGISLRNEISNGNMFFQTYSMYNLVFNFTKIYKIN